jgi:hypothetical protein
MYSLTNIPLHRRDPAFGKLGHFNKVLGEKLRLLGDFLRATFALDYRQVTFESILVTGVST